MKNIVTIATTHELTIQEALDLHEQGFDLVVNDGLHVWVYQ